MAYWVDMSEQENREWTRDRKREREKQLNSRKYERKKTNNENKDCTRLHKTTKRGGEWFG